jgi:hypothetical protein
MAASCVWEYRRRRAPRSARDSIYAGACYWARPAKGAGDDSDIGVPLLPRTHAAQPDDALAPPSARDSPTAPVAGVLSFTTSDYDDVLLSLLATADAAAIATSGAVEGEQARLPRVHMTCMRITWAD